MVTSTLKKEKKVEEKKVEEKKVEEVKTKVAETTKAEVKEAVDPAIIKKRIASEVKAAIKAKK